ncbi:MAG: hypothetical protein WC091_20225 [Sulfuricellaceae bacterium]
MNATVCREPAGVILCVLAATILLSGCGGGGGTETPAAISFPVARAFQSTYQNGLQRTFNQVYGNGRSATLPFDSGITGSTLTLMLSAALPATFNGVSGYQSTSTISGPLTLYNQMFPLNLTGTDYLNSNYQLIGSTASGNYCVTDSPGVYPTTLTDVQGHQTGTIVAYTCYADSSKATMTGTETLTYDAHPSIVGTMSFGISDNMYDPAGALTTSSTSYYAITTDGILTVEKKLVSASSNGFTLNLGMQ